MAPAGPLRPPGPHVPARRAIAQAVPAPRATV